MSVGELQAAVTERAAAEREYSEAYATFVDDFKAMGAGKLSQEAFHSSADALGYCACKLERCNRNITILMARDYANRQGLPGSDCGRS